MRLAVDREDWERAAAIAAEAERAHPGTKWLRGERGYMALQSGRWDEAMRLASPENRPALAVAAATHGNDKRTSLTLAKQAFDANPALPAAGLTYADLLRRNGRERQAREVLRQAWSAHPHPDIAAAFVDGITDKLERAREIAVLVRSNPDNVESHIAVAQAALDAGLTADAKQHLEQAKQSGVNERRMWSLMADTYVMAGDAQAAQEALRQIATAGPNPVWRCINCGTQHEHWHAVCTACRATGTIHWGAPAETAPTRYRVPPPQGVEGTRDLNADPQSRTFDRPA